MVCDCILTATKCRATPGGENHIKIIEKTFSSEWFLDTDTD